MRGKGGKLSLALQAQIDRLLLGAAPNRKARPVASAFRYREQRPPEKMARAICNGWAVRSTDNLKCKPSQEPSACGSSSHRRGGTLAGFDRLRNSPGTRSLAFREGRLEACVQRGLLSGRNRGACSRGEAASTPVAIGACAPLSVVEGHGGGRPAARPWAGLPG
jgi:hypothetical protein